MTVVSTRLYTEVLVLVFMIIYVSRLCVVNTDASDEGLSAVVSQHYNGVDRPISFASRTLSAQEKQYFAQEKVPYYLDLKDLSRK